MSVPLTNQSSARGLGIEGTARAKKLPIVHTKEERFT
jgi:hypothetical protein